MRCRAKFALWRTLLAVGLFIGLLSPGLPETANAQVMFDWMNTPGVSPDEVNAVAREIWCPLCSGVRLDSCELKACHQMKDVIAMKLAEGATTAEIKDYFLVQYGPQILGEPPREGFNWLAWILPFAAIAGGGVFLWRQSQRLVRPVQPAAPLAAAGPTSGRPQSEAERRLDEELAKYG